MIFLTVIFLEWGYLGRYIHLKTEPNRFRSYRDLKIQIYRRRSLDIFMLEINQIGHILEHEQDNESTEVISKIVIEKLIAEDSERLTILPCHDISKA